MKKLLILSAVALAISGGSALADMMATAAELERPRRPWLELSRGRNPRRRPVRRHRLLPEPR